MSRGGVKIFYLERNRNTGSELQGRGRTGEERISVKVKLLIGEIAGDLFEKDHLIS